MRLPVASGGVRGGASSAGRRLRGASVPPPQLTDEAISANHPRSRGPSDVEGSPTNPGPRLERPAPRTEGDAFAPRVHWEDEMASVVTAQHRAEQGKGPARRLRQKGLIPAVVYGRKSEPTHLAVDPGALMKAIETPHRFNTVLTLKMDGAGEKHVLFKDYAVDPVTRKLLHADFLEVKLDEPVKVEVPVVTTGRSPGQAEGGILSIAA